MAIGRSSSVATHDDVSTPFNWQERSSNGRVMVMAACPFDSRVGQHVEAGHRRNVGHDMLAVIVDTHRRDARAARLQRAAASANMRSQPLVNEARESGIDDRSHLKNGKYSQLGSS
jgi:hypothetical protein